MTDFDNRVFVFTVATLERALDDWVARQVAAYPHQEERIRIAALAMRDFFDSEQVGRHKMILGTEARSDERDPAE